MNRLAFTALLVVVAGVGAVALFNTTPQLITIKATKQKKAHFHQLVFFLQNFSFFTSV